MYILSINVGILVYASIGFRVGFDRFFCTYKRHCASFQLFALKIIIIIIENQREDPRIIETDNKKRAIHPFLSVTSGGMVKQNRIALTALNAR